MIHREVLTNGDEYGNGLVVRWTLASGRQIYGLATKNLYSHGWNLGPTWNYLVLGDRPFLVDTGRTGTGPMLLDLMEKAGVSPRDLDFVVLTHGHEDHDGGLPELVSSNDIRIKAHRIYDRLIRLYPDLAPTEEKRTFPAACWRCFMPEEWVEANCREYNRVRSGLEIETIGDEDTRIAPGVVAHWTPGHSPDAICLRIDDEVLLVGDTILPDITPFPSQESFYGFVSGLLRPEYEEAGVIYGLGAYLRSLGRLKRLGEKYPGLLPLPGHRLFHNGRWQPMDLDARIDEMARHHVDRSADILGILGGGPKTAREIAVEHFDESVLKGFGIYMAMNEVLSHSELMAACGDVVFKDRKTMEATGARNFEGGIRSMAGF